MSHSLLKGGNQSRRVIAVLSVFMLLISLALAQSPSPSPSVSPTAAPEPSPSSSPSPSPTASPTCCSCPSPSPTVSPSPKPSPTASPAVSPTPFVIPKPKGEPVIKITSVCPTAFIKGDANADGDVDISDSIYLSYALQGKYTLACQDAADVNDDEIINSKDYEYLLSYLFEGGSPPQAPFPVAGMDEDCDGKDNDLDGKIDEGCPQEKIEEKITQSCSSYKRGDANSDGEIDVSDSIYVSMYLRGEVKLVCRDAADANVDGKITTEDAKYILAYLFEGGPKPPEISGEKEPEPKITPTPSPTISPIITPSPGASPKPSPAKGFFGKIGDFFKNLLG